MFKDSKPTRDLAKFFVFIRLGTSVLTVILSSLVSTVISVYYQYSAYAQKVDIYDPKNIKVTALVALAATLVNLPLNFCATTFFYDISSKGPREKLGIKDFFEPFSRPAYLLKGTLLMFILMILNTLGIVLLVFPVYFTFCMAPYVLKTKPETSVWKALTTSCQMMHGVKMKAFKTIIPIMGAYLVCGFISYYLYLLGFLGLAVTQAVFHVTIALIFHALIVGEECKNIMISKIMNSEIFKYDEDTETDSSADEEAYDDGEIDEETDTDDE